MAYGPPAESGRLQWKSTAFYNQHGFKRTFQWPRRESLYFSLQIPSRSGKFRFVRFNIYGDNFNAFLRIRGVDHESITDIHANVVHLPFAFIVRKEHQVTRLQVFLQNGVPLTAWTVESLGIEMPCCL